MDIKIIGHNSNEFAQMIRLRITQLLEPIGVPASYIDEKKEKDDFLIAAFEKDEMIGCCVLTPKDDRAVQLRQMAVRSHYRGKGIGAAIIDFAEKIARENNFLLVTMHARDPVIDFYKKCGYQIFDDPLFEVGIGHHKMRKQL